MSDKKWSFDIGARVRLKLSGEQGVVLGRAEYKTSADSYYVIYKTADGRQVTGWCEDGWIVDAGEDE